MSGCLMVGTLMLALSGNAFTLDWTHSVERVVWREDWLIQGGALRLTGAAIKGSGAGMEPGEGAILKGGWWVWHPALPPQPQILLAASGATGGGWRICDPGLPPDSDSDSPDRCAEIGERPGEALALRPCPPD